jgi:hypothetical protein
MANKSVISRSRLVWTGERFAFPTSGKPITTGLPGTYTSARSDHYRVELRRRGSYHLAMEIREFLGRDSHAKNKKTCRPFEFRYNQLDGNDFLRSIPSDTSRVLPQ